MKRLALIKLSCMVLFSGVTLGAQAKCARLVLAADPDYPPLHWYDGSNMQGASISIAKRVLDDLKIPYELRYLGPFPRVLAAAQRGEIDMVATLKKTPERETYLLYPKTAALMNPIAVFTARERPITYSSRSDLVGLRGGITRSNVFGDGFDEYMKQNLSIEEANSPANNFSKLDANRLDYFITGYYTGMAHLLKRGDEDRFVAISPFLVETPNYMVLTRKGQCADKLEAIDARLALLKKNGILDELISQSFAQWKASPVVVVK
jgi:polar amino acid transport system substrate-binding protein